MNMLTLSKNFFIYFIFRVWQERKEKKIKKKFVEKVDILRSLLDYNMEM